MIGSRGLVLSLCGLAGALIALPALILWINAAQQRAKLDEYRAELARRGEKLGIAELAPPPTFETTAGDKLIAAATALENQVKRSSIKLAAGLILNEAGQSEIAHRRNTVRRMGKETAWEEFAREMDPLQPLLAEIRAASRPEDLRLQVDYSREIDMRLEFLTPTLRSGQQLSNECLLLLREGKSSSAVENTQAILKLAAMLGEEPIMISQMTSCSLIGLAQATTWMILQEEISRADLQALLSSWERIKPGKNAAAALRLERAWFHAYLNTKNPKPEISDAPAPEHNLIWELCCRFKDERHTLQDFQDVIEAIDAGEPWPDILARAATLRKDAKDAGIARLWGAKADSLSRLAIFPKAQSLQNLSVAALAIRLHQLDHDGALPDTLKALVPRYLTEVPSDPMDNRPLRYQPSGSDFTLYAIGTDNADDSGNASPPTGQKLAALINRRDIVWPKVDSAAPVK